MIIFAMALLANFLSLVWVTKVHKIGISVLLKNPAFLFGDFFLIPLYFSLGVDFLLEKGHFSLQKVIISLLIATFIVVIWGKRFNLLKPEWLPHGIMGILVISLLI